jgi:hypothetical protein
MKTAKHIFALSLLLVAGFLIGSTSFAQVSNITATGTTAVGTPFVTYVVHLKDSPSLHDGSSYWVLLNDQKGNLIGKQVFSQDILDYVFTETGNVDESRTASLSLDGKQVWAKEVNYGPFSEGNAYEFNLVPIK